jgi:hypothetical protein
MLECLSVRCAWVPVATSYRTKPLGCAASQGPSLGRLPSTREPLGTTVESWGCPIVIIQVGRSYPSTTIVTEGDQYG